MLDPLGPSLEAGVVEEVGPTTEGPELAPVVLAVRQHHDPTVEGASRPTVRGPDAVVAETAQGRVEGVATQVLDQIERRHGLGHRHLDRGALAGP